MSLLAPSKHEVSVPSRVGVQVGSQVGAQVDLWPNQSQSSSSADTTSALPGDPAALDEQGCLRFAGRARQDLEAAWADELNVPPAWLAAASCPGVLPVMRVRALALIQHWSALPPGSESDNQFADWSVARGRELRAARELLALSDAEAQRSGSVFGGPLDARYWRGLVDLALGESERAIDLLRPGIVAPSARAFLVGASRVAPYRSRRALALALLHAGHLEEARTQAALAVQGSPRRWRAAAAYVLALTYDRLGDSTAARSWALWAMDRDRGQVSIRIVAGVLPLAERLLLRAFLHGLNPREATASLRYWRAYVALDSLSELDRGHARRHIERLDGEP